MVRTGSTHETPKGHTAVNKFVIGLVGCLAVLIGGGMSARQASDREHAEFGGWSTPVNLGPVINSSVRDVGASVSRDGLSLYFSSARAGTTDLYVSRRRAVDLPWETPEPLAMLNTDVGDSGPSLSRDNRYLFFSSNRTGGFGSTDFFVSERRFTQDDLGWGPPTRLPSPPNSAGQEVEPLFIEYPGGRPRTSPAVRPPPDWTSMRASCAKTERGPLRNISWR